MMGGLWCVFMMCNWVFHCNLWDGDRKFGLYQCSRCKTISVGAEWHN